jgi:hypothetical protein
VASDYFLTTAQAQALGNRWLDVSVSGGEDSVMSGVLDMAADPSVGLDELLPATPSYGSTFSRTRTTLDGQPVYQLSADGETWDVTTGAIPYLLRAATSYESIEFGQGALARPERRHHLSAADRVAVAVVAA